MRLRAGDRRASERDTPSLLDVYSRPAYASPRGTSQTNAIKHSREVGLSYAILEAVGRTPQQIEPSLFDVFTQKTSGVLSNTSGPREPVHLAGNKIAGVVPWVPAAGEPEACVDVAAPRLRDVELARPNSLASVRA